MEFESSGGPKFQPGYEALVAERRARLHDQLLTILPREQQASFVWEVGCGHGHFLTAYASHHPAKTCVGVDLVSERIERAEKKRRRANLANLHFVRATAALFLDALPTNARISEVFILFPDPWPKSRHHKHRVLQPEFLTALAARTTHDCSVYFRTDHHPYFTEAETVVRESPAWQLADAAWPFEYETVFQSRAEQHHSFIAQRRSLNH